MSYTFQSVFLELRKSMRLSLPLVCSQLIYALSGMITTIMVAHLGRNELATNALVWSVYITLVLFFFGVQNAVSALVAQNHGANNNKGIHATITQSIVLAFAFTIPYDGDHMVCTENFMFYGAKFNRCPVGHSILPCISIRNITVKFVDCY